MGFKKISGNKNPDINEMRKKMKEKQSTVHTNPLLEKPVTEQSSSQKKENGKMGRRDARRYTQHFSTYLSKDQEERFLSWCEENGMSPSMAIRLAVVQMMGK